MEPANSYDALLIVSFGGPERHEDVIPFLENVLRGKNVRRERMLEVAEHYYHFDGRSPINEHARALIAALQDELTANGPRLPIYWGNRNWHPILADTLRQMKSDGIRCALAFMTSAFGSYSGCRQYREDVERARAEVGPDAPQIDKLRSFYNHPGFIGPLIESVANALAVIPAERRTAAHVIFTAHSIPLAMAETSPYVPQLEEACRLIGEGIGRPDWRLVYQSRSGPPGQPWLEPDILQFLRELAEQGGPRDLIVAPIGFLSDHIEVLYDLDTEARSLADALGLNMVRAATVGTHPDFIRMIRELIQERLGEIAGRRAMGSCGPSPDVCPADCCPAPRPPAARP